jgi:hypothetical protein
MMVRTMMALAVEVEVELTLFVADVMTMDNLEERYRQQETL